MFKNYTGSKCTGIISQILFSGTVFHFREALTKAFASKRPNPNLVFTLKPAAFVFHPGLSAKGIYCDVKATKCCISLQFRLGLEFSKLKHLIT